MSRSRRLIVFLGVTALVVAALVPLAPGGLSRLHEGGYVVMWPMMSGGYGWWGWWGWWMMIPMVMFWGIVVWGFVHLVSQNTRSSESRHYNREGMALEELKLRYARGEIGKEEYEEKRRDLQ